MKLKNDFKRGLLDGIPIGLGYLSVSIGVGIMAVGSGLNIITALLISMSCLTSAGEVAGIGVIAAGGSYIEMALIQLVINIRYSLMGISLSQKLDSSFTTGKRLLLSTFITDENFGMASSYDTISTKYMSGLVIIPYIGWSVGTLIGAAAGKILPPSVEAALGMAIYGMFIAIVVPSLKKSKYNVIAVAIAIALSCLIYFKLSYISYGFAVIIASVAASIVAAALKCKKGSGGIAE